jgi:hypothetical protein
LQAAKIWTAHAPDIPPTPFCDAWPTKKLICAVVAIDFGVSQWFV